MDKKCNNKNPLVRGGTSQPQRILKTLQKDYVHIDEHSYADLILFAKNFSKHLHYFNLNNQQSGNWEDFFSYDVSLLISFIANNDIREYDQAFQGLLKLMDEDIFHLSDAGNLIGEELKDTVKNNLPDYLPNFKKLFDFILSLAHLLDQQIDRLPDEIGLKFFASSSIQQHCNEPFRDLLGLYKVGIEAMNYVIIDDTQISPFPTHSALPQKYTQQVIVDGLALRWLANGTSLSDVYTSLLASEYTYAFGTNAPSIATKPIDVEKWIRPAVKALESIYNSLSKVFFKIISESPRYLEETLNEWQNHTPHIALYLSFLKLFRFTQDRLNGLKEEHVNFYYKEILRLEERPAKPDEVFALIELNKQIDTFLVEKDTAFKAGKDNEGKERIYKTTSGAAINKATVTQLKSIYKHPSSGKIYAAPIVNSEDGAGEPLITEDGSWHPFGPITKFIDGAGNITSPTNAENELMEIFTSVNRVAEVGFAIASPNLYLNGGTRDIEINIMGDHAPDDPPLVATWPANQFKILLTTLDGWIEKMPNENLTFSSGKINLKVKLNASDPKLVPYNQAIHGGSFRTQAPVIKILLLNHNNNFPYNDLKKFSITRVETKVIVEGLKDILVQSETGRLDLSNPILPFGAITRAGASLIIGSKEVFQKKLLDIDENTNEAKRLQLNIVWEGLEDKSNVFLPASPIKVSQGYLKNNVWVNEQNENRFKDLSTSALATTNFIHINQASSISRNTLSNFDYSEDERFTPNAKDGFIRISLKNDFGQKDFQRELPRTLIELAKATPDTTQIDARFVSGSSIVLRDPPYIPSFKELSINYTAVSSFDLTESNNFENRVEQFFHLHSFGQCERHTVLIKQNEELTLLPQFDYEGDLMIGIKDLHPQQSVSVLFQIADGSANPLKAKQDVNWFYLFENNWYPFISNPKANINDQTNGLSQSGLITYFLPKKINTDNTWLETSHIWLKASVKKDVDAICNIIDIKAQAIRLRFEDQNNAADVLVTPLPPKSVKKLLEPTTAIKKIEQPYSSFGGKLQEQDEHFHKRISERLRHKDRAITIWDYEHLILEEFPEIYRVKCLNHTQVKSLSPPNQNQKIINEVAPGHVVLITIPNLQHRNAVASLKPYTSLNTLSQISSFIKKRISPHVQLEVVNPLFEEIELNFQVEFTAGIDFTLYVKILNQDILKFLSPWAYQSETQKRLEFGGSIYKSVLLDFIEELDYVDFITNFQLNQYISLANVKMDVEDVVASTPGSILVSVPQHTINEVTLHCI